MPISFNFPGSFLSNKPKLPKPTPPSELFPTVLTPPGRKIWVSVPFPDRLTILCPLIPVMSDDFTYQPFGPNPELHAVGQYLKGAPGGTTLDDFYYAPMAGYFRDLTLLMGVNGAPVRFEFKNDAKPGKRVRIELNPNRLGKSGIVQLIAILEDPVGPFAISKFMEHAKVTRLDVAVDVVGAWVREMLPWYSKQGKRAYYVGDDGELETIYVHRVKPPPTLKFDKAGQPKPIKHKQPAGRLILSVYDKVRERVAVLEPPPFGAAPVTRIEKRNMFTTFKLADLASLKDAFADVRVGMVTDDQLALDERWHEYVAIRRTHTPQMAAFASKLSETDAQTYSEKYEAVSGNIVGAGVNWSEWNVGLSYTGLDQLLGKKQP